MKNRRGISQILVTIIMIAIVLASTIIFWNIVKDIIYGKTDLIETRYSGVDLKIQSVSKSDDDLYVKVKRNQGGNEISGIRFVLLDIYGNTQFVDADISLNELEEKKFNMTPDDLSKVKKVSIAPRYGGGSSSSVGDITDEYEIDINELPEDNETLPGNETNQTIPEDNETNETLPLSGDVWYVRPYRNEGYGLGDGSSYENAWNGLTDYPKTDESVVWGAGGVKPGDTLYVCGTHVYNLTNPYQSFVAQGDINMIGGSGEDSRVVVRGDCPEEKGVVWGAYNPEFAEWTNEGSGVWSTIPPGSHITDWFFEITDLSYPNSFITLDKEFSLSGVKSNPGSHYSTDYNGGSKIYIHTSDGNTPEGKVLFPGYGYEFVIGSNSYITFYDLTEINFQRIVGYNPSNPPSHLTWDHCNLSYGTHSLIWVFNGMNYMKVLNSELSWAGNGIYTISTPSTGDMNSAPSYYEFSGNYIHDMGVRDFNYNSDAHGIGIQGGHDGLIEGNIFENCGTGVTLYTYTGQELKDIIIKNNVVKNLHQLGGAGGHGIESQTNNDNLADVSGLIINNNIIMNVDTGIRLQFHDNQKVFNNVLYNNRLGFETTRTENAIDIYDVSYDASRGEVFVGQTSGASAKVAHIRIEDDNTGIVTLDDVSGTFTVGESLLIEGIYFAKAVSDKYSMGADVTLRNNIFLDNSESHIRWGAGAKIYDLDSNNNLFWPADEDLFYISYIGPGVNLDEWQDLDYLDCVFDSNSIEVDPKFVNPSGGDFHLQAGSPAIDEGVDIGIEEDFEGNFIPQGNAPDIGAYEY